MLGFACARATAEEAARPVAPMLTLTGTATLQARPDFASVSIGVASKAPTTAAALDATSAAAGRILASAGAFGIEPRDLQTSYVSLQPAFRNVRESGGSSEQRPDGYTASNTVTIRIRDLGKLGEFLRTVVDGGANRIDGVEFELAEPAKLQRQVLAAAVRDAREQAAVIAEAAGVKLGRIEEIRFGADRPYSAARRSRAVAAAAPAPAVPIEAGSLDVSAEVQVVFALEQP